MTRLVLCLRPPSAAAVYRMTGLRFRAGTYTALAGVDAGLALWNFDYYIEVVGGSYAAYDFRLLYDFDPAAGNYLSTHGAFYVPGTLIAGGFAPRQGSENLAMPWLDTASPPYVTPPPLYPSFSPTALGEYTFALQVYGVGGIAPLDTVAIRVNAAPVPEPATITVLGMGLGAFALGRLRKRRG